MHALRQLAREVRGMKSNNEKANDILDGEDWQVSAQEGYYPVVDENSVFTGGISEAGDPCFFITRDGFCMQRRKGKGE
jgi:hypothetical protein